MGDDVTDEIRERTSDGTVGGTADGDSDAVLTLDAGSDEHASSNERNTDSSDDNNGN